MEYGTIDGVDRQISKLVLGTLGHESESTAGPVLDAFFSAGGNAIDTAWTYGQGRQEEMLGRWLERNEMRAQTVIVAKGAHTPYCTPEHVTSQLEETLTRLRTDHVDVYLLHRDNPDVPAGEFVDVLNEHTQAGRMLAFGGSNWTLDRVAAANEYARANGRRGFALVSNQFSLAEMVRPIFPGCISAGDRESRAWFEREQLALLAWSSQARGFFVRADRPLERYHVNEARRMARRAAARLLGRGGGPLRDELAVSWYSRENFRRLDRARELARERNVATGAIALGYVLAQPFPTFAAVGPERPEELQQSLAALDVSLSGAELEWLDGRSAVRG